MIINYLACFLAINFVYLSDYQIDMSNDKNTIIDYFGEMEDFRMDRKKRHSLIDIITIAIAATLCGCEGYEEIEDFGHVRLDWFKTFLELPNGIPSHDTFNRVFALMDPEKFETCFRTWVNTILESPKGQLISIDGKTIKGAKSGGVTSPIHMVSAWLGEDNLVLGQVKVKEKSNEITAIPELIQGLFIKDCIISMDAMGCQEDIAKVIINQEGDYVLAVKNNQPTLHENTLDSFRFFKPNQVHESVDIGHGRIERRKCSIITNLGHIEQPEKWKNLKVLIKIESERYFKVDKKTETAIRYYIASKLETASFYQEKIRSHWAIENKLHWTLDVVFQEDASRKRFQNASQNFSLINKVALNIIKNDKTKTCSMKRKRRIAAMDVSYLEVLLNF